MNVVVVVGNPKIGSRTRRAADMIAQRLTGTPPASAVELAELGPALLEWGSPAVQAAKQVVLGSDLLIVASPIFKATYTGLLKLFLDHFAAGELANTPAVALMLGASPRHALAGEHCLKPVLSEIGCACPAPALFLLESAWEASLELEQWLARASGAYDLPPAGQHLAPGDTLPL
ncbi:MAG TPA: NAD(P)H-dependent oxidoreductase [Acidimicrobiales bacterium]|nr:NAD(P)H-dependent oxidoreductase [Acidimicrobiales bacterium]